MTTRKIKESPLYQGEDERIAYTITTTPWGSTPGSVSVVLKNSNGTDISSTNLSGAAATAGDVITTPLVIGLVRGQKYTLEVKFVCSGNTFEAYCEIIGE